MEDTLTANGNNLNDVLSTAFTIDLYSGVIKLNFAVSQSMKGYFEFKVQALDLGKKTTHLTYLKYFKYLKKKLQFAVDHTDECDIKIFIIAESCRVTFVLLNTKETVERQKLYVLLIDFLSVHNSTINFVFSSLIH